ncbi:MAG TPA: YCF48-related protein [Blastocatellia bacterium]|nr:YCF48-related protein [Blastocatellia bacterium]
MANGKRAAFIVMAIVCLAALSCKTSQQNGSGQAAKANLKASRWVTKYRSPMLKNYPANSDLRDAIYYSSISVVSPDVVFVAGDMRDPQGGDARIAVVVRTTDGGQTWAEKVIQQPNLEFEALNAIHFVSPQVGWVIGVDSAQDGILAKTSDGGESWAIQRLAFKQRPTTIFFADANTGWIGGTTLIEENNIEEDVGPSSILATTDGGQTWQPQMNLPVSIYDIYFIDRTTGWATGSFGAIYHTTDGGRNWDKQTSELELGSVAPNFSGEGRKRWKLSGVHFTDADHGFVAAAAGETAQSGDGWLLATSNGGKSWTKQKLGEGRLKDVFFINPDQGWVLKDETKFIYLTTDGGKSWLTEFKDYEQPVSLARIAAADAAHVWAVGGDTIFFRVAN